MKQRHIFDYHASMLADAHRIGVFERAIERIVRPGNVVLDIGAGTGILSYLACCRGAARVYAIERGPVHDLAKEAFRRNGVADRVVLIRGHSEAVQIPEKVDVIVGEIVGNVGLDEQILSAFTDARTRFLKPGGRLIPQSIRIVVAPIEHPEAYASKVLCWDGIQHGFDLSSLRNFSACQVHRIAIPEHTLRGQPATIIDVDLRTVDGRFATGKASFEISTKSTIHGLGAWFEAELSDSLEVTNGPPNRVPSWTNCFFPFVRPIEVGVGSVLKVQLSTHDGEAWRWSVRVAATGNREAEELDQSSLDAFPINMLEMQAAAPKHTPRLSSRGRAALHVLQTIDGVTTVEELISNVARRFADELPTTASARSLVTELLREFGGLGDPPTGA